MNRIPKSILIISSMLMGIWVLPHPIWIRDVLLYSLLILLIQSKLEWKILWPAFLPAVVWASYLIFYPLISPDTITAFSSLRAWFRSIVFIAVGAGVGLTLAKHYVVTQKNNDANILTWMSTALALPIAAHLTLVLIAWIWGWHPTRVFGDISTIISGAYNFPMGYWGLQDHHAELGYVSLFIVGFSSSAILTRKNLKLSRKIQWWHFGLIIASLTSMLIARSRAGITFSLIVIFLTILFFTLKNYRGKAKKIFTYLLIGISIISTIIWGGYRTDPTRWGNLFHRLSVGFYGNPIEINCNGINTLRNELIKQNIPITPEVENAIQSVNGWDGARTMTARAGLILLRENPLGVDGSKSSYWKAIREKCKSPAIDMAHTHNGWIDTGLAIGIPGLIILFGVFASLILFSRKQYFSKITSSPYSLALLALSISWFFRGFTDSIYRDHIIQMQGFFLALLCAYLISTGNRNLKKSSD